MIIAKLLLTCQPGRTRIIINYVPNPELNSGFYDCIEKIWIKMSTEPDLKHNKYLISRSVRSQLSFLGAIFCGLLAFSDAKKHFITSYSADLTVRDLTVQNLSTENTISASSPEIAVTPIADPSPQPIVITNSIDNIEYDVDKILYEFKKLQVRDPERLLSTVMQAQAVSDNSSPLSTLLSLAVTETHGKILAVSSSGAVGLAQAMPLEILRSGLQPLVIGADDALGMRAYVAKKPLWDVCVITDLLINNIDCLAAEIKAFELLSAAKELRREGFMDIYDYAAIMPPEYLAEAELLDQHNLEIIEELEGLMSTNAQPDQLIEFRRRIYREYRALYDIQKNAWNNSQANLIRQRDNLLYAKYHQESKIIMKNNQYAAGEYLAGALDIRFSPSAMAPFMISHFDQKLNEARELGLNDDQLQLAIRAYNGGWLNVLRSKSGLISLPENDNYLSRVQNLSAKIDLCQSKSEPLSANSKDRRCRQM